MAALLMAASASAYDFSKRLKNGNTLWFSVIPSANTDLQYVKVVAPGGTDVGYEGFAQPSGRLSIPEEIQYDGTFYRVVSVDERAFAGCAALTAVTIPSGVTSIGGNAFKDCLQLTSLTLDCDSLGPSYNLFWGCDRLDTLVIGPSVRCLPPFLFADIRSLKVILFRAVQPESMKNLFFGCHSPAALVVGRNVGCLPEFLCYNYVGLRDIACEGDSAALTSISRCAFVNCMALRNIVLPVSLTSLGDNAFAHCTPLSFTFRSRTVPECEGNPFFGIGGGIDVYVPCGTRGAYANSVVGRHFSRIGYLEDCGIAPVGSDTVFIHDTVYIHDTIYLTPVFADVVSEDSGLSEEAEDAEENGTPEDGEETADGEELEFDADECLHVEGRILRISCSLRLKGQTLRLFDEKGRLVVDDRIPPDQPVDNYYVRLPRRQRYYLRIGNLSPVVVE